MACRAGSVASSHLRDRRLLTSSSSITLLPFLYQTRTIQTTAPRPRPSHTLTTTPATIHARCISSSRQASGPVKTTNPDEDDDPWSGGPEESRRPPSRQHSRREQLPAEPWSHHVPFAHLETPASRTRKSHDIPLAESEAPATDNKSTLTDLERKAFYRLFQSLTPSSGDRNDSRTALESLDELDDVTRFGADSTTSYDTSSDLERILTEDPIDPRSAGGSAIERYPPALQSMAQRAEARLAAQQRLQRAYQDGEEQQLAETNPAMEEERLQLKRIERDMRAAETDQELWTILDREVFESMRIIQETEDQLAASDAVRREEAYAHTATQAHAQKPRKRGRPKKSPVHTTEPPSQATSTTPTPLAPLAIDLDTDSAAEPAIAISSYPPTATRSSAVSPLPQPSHPRKPTFRLLVRAYPALILVAARLLARRTAYTPLALALLPALKCIGLTAWALAASTPLYNELLAYQWRVLHATAPMLRTLAEMQRAGVPADAATLDVLRDVALYRRAALEGRLGGMARAVEGMWARGEEARRLEEWAEGIRTRLEAGAMERLARGRAEGRLRSEGLLE